MTTITLHSMLSLERETGVGRQVLRGIISGLGLTTYNGPKHSICIDDEGKERLLAHLKEHGFLDD